MSKTPVKPDGDFRPDPNRKHPPIDTSVKLPQQVRDGAALADDLVAGRQPRPKSQQGKVPSQPGFPYTDAQIDHVLERIERGELDVGHSDFGVLRELAREGGRLIKGHRRGAQQQRRKKDIEVTRRLVAIIQEYSELTPTLQKHPTGTGTLHWLRRRVIKKLGLRDDDNVISEDTLRHDIQQVRPILRLIQRGAIPPPGKPIKRGISEKTLQEMEEGRRAAARAASAEKA
jgi:hypothetical protein